MPLSSSDHCYGDAWGIHAVATNQCRDSGLTNAWRDVSYQIYGGDLAGRGTSGPRAVRRGWHTKPEDVRSGCGEGILASAHARATVYSTKGAVFCVWRSRPSRGLFAEPECVRARKNCGTIPGCTRREWAEERTRLADDVWMARRQCQLAAESSCARCWSRRWGQGGGGAKLG